MGPEILDLIVMLKYIQDLWNEDRNKESPHMAARIIHIDNEEKKKILRHREEQARVARATLPYDNNDEEDHYDNYDQDDLLCRSRHHHLVNRVQSIDVQTKCQWQD